MGNLTLIRLYRKRLNWARLVSDVLSPPVVWGTFALPIALRDAVSFNQALVWATIYVFFVCLLPVLYIAYMVRVGAITDIHMKVRRQRLRPFGVSIICAGIAWGILHALGAPDIVPLFAFFSLVQLFVMACITVFWQISIHAISIAGITVAQGALFGAIPALMTMPLIFLVGLARLKLQRHTPAQVIAGTLVGAVIPFVMLFIQAG